MFRTLSFDPADIVATEPVTFRIALIYSQTSGGTDDFFLVGLRDDSGSPALAVNGVVPEPASLALLALAGAALIGRRRSA